VYADAPLDKKKKFRFSNMCGRGKGNLYTMSRWFIGPARKGDVGRDERVGSGGGALVGLLLSCLIQHGKELSL
jgi:hypothetical protein